MTINVNLIKRYLVYRKAGELFPGIFKSIINSYISDNYFSQIILGITAEMYRLFSVKSYGIVGADRYVLNLFACYGIAV